MTPTEKTENLDLHQQAFGPQEGPAIAALAADLLAHPDTVSISAHRQGHLAGNVLFSRFYFEKHPAVTCHLLAPCGVLPGFQGTGVGKEIMETGIAHLKSLGSDAVFVLGIPDFYPLYGFTPARQETPYPTLLTVYEAWMALELTPGVLARLDGPTKAIDPFMQSHFWDTSQHG